MKFTVSVVPWPHQLVKLMLLKITIILNIIILKIIIILITHIYYRKDTIKEHPGKDTQAKTEVVKHGLSCPSSKDVSFSPPSKCRELCELSLPKKACLVFGFTFLKRSQSPTYHVTSHGANPNPGITGTALNLYVHSEQLTPWSILMYRFG